MKITKLLFAILLMKLSGFSQNTIGLPEVLNYSKQSYKAGAQNRQIRQDKNGLLYFANNEGLLTFDGISWKTYPLPNKSIVRSVEFGPDNKLYVGGQDEFGYFSPASNGSLVYRSLKMIVPENERSFTDVWEIYFYKNAIFFQTSNKIIQIEGEHCTVYKSVHWRFIGPCGDRLLAQDFDRGLLNFDNGLWKPFLTACEMPQDGFITSIISIGKDTSLVTTVKHGVFLLFNNQLKKLQSPALQNIAAMHISAAAMVNDKHIALTTNLNGCYIIDKKGNLIQNFARQEGLQNNNILDIFLDREKNIWLGLDNGIDFIAFNNAVKHIYPDYSNEGSGYAAFIHENKLFIGTSNGLYQVPVTNTSNLSYIKSDFLPVSNTKGQVWNLSEVNGRLLMGHHDGGFLIENNSAKPIDNTSGFWTFLPFENIIPSSLMVAGTYQGLNFYSFENGRFINKQLQAHFESARFIVNDNGTLWSAHPYKGIYKVSLQNGKPEIKQYDTEKGVLSVNGNYIFKAAGAILLTTEKGIFEYNAGKDKFEPSQKFNQLFKGKAVRYLKEDNSGNIWFVFDKTIGVIDMSAKTPHIIYFPELNNRFVSGFEFIYPYNKNNIFIGGEKGFFHIDYEHYKQLKYPLEVMITGVKAINERDSVLYGGFAIDKPNKVSVSHAWNSFHFQFAAPVFSQQSNIEYSYQLEAFENNWSAFSKKTEKEYTNLPAGTYTFKVKARNNLGNESQVKTYTFTVLPPWYQSLTAKIIYTLIAGVVLFGVYGRQKRKFSKQAEKHEQEQKKLLYMHTLELDSAEKEIMRLKNEKLEAEVQHKTTELASTAMHLVKKGELLTKIKEELTKLKKRSADLKELEEVKKLLKILQEEDKMDEDWEHFAFHFDKVHADFLRELKNKHPKLSPNELKLCAYLRMNLSSKEIAQLMNISVRGVEISRYRLRKKFELPTEISLFDFLIGNNIEGNITITANKSAEKLS